MPVAAALAVAALAVAVVDEPQAVEIVRPFLVGLWALAGAVLSVRRSSDRVAPIALAGAVVGGVGSLAAAIDAHDTVAGGAAWGLDLAVRLSAAVLAAIALQLLLGLPDGRLGIDRSPPAGRRRLRGRAWPPGRRMMADRAAARRVAPRAAVAGVCSGLGLPASHTRYVVASAVDRRRMQWFGWGVAVATEGDVGGRRPQPAR